MDSVTVHDEFVFSQVTCENVKSCFKEIPSNKATGLDHLPCCVLKNSLSNIIEPLTHIINLSLKEGRVPHEWKRASITPLFKGGDNMLPVNYRPISVLSVLSKVLEKLVFKQVYSYLDKNDILVSNQYGFRPKYSTTFALLDLIENIR